MFHPTTIKHITRLSPTAVNIELNTPTGQNFSFQAGQHLVVRIPSLDPSQHRSYSISAAPSENKLQIGVKRLKGGLISGYLCDRAKTGDPIDIMLPQGNFHLPSPGTIQSIVAFAAGSGITPVISIIKDHLERGMDHKAMLFFGNKTKDDVMYAAALQDLQTEYDTRFKMINIYSRQEAGMKHLEGRIDSEKIITWKAYLFEMHFTDAFFLCGPGNMVMDLEKTLQSFGVDKSKIYTELFTPPVHENAGTELKETATRYTLEYKLNKKWHTVYADSNQNVLLDIGLKQGLDLPYSCQSGVCSTCQAKLLEGQVTMDNNYVLSDKELKDGFILTCQSHAMTNTLRIDYDMK